MSKAAKKFLLFFILYGTMFLFGYIENIKGVTYPLIKAEFDVSYDQQGVMVSLLSLSYVLFCFIGGILISSFGVKKSFAAGYIIMIIGLAGAFFMPGFLHVSAALFLVSASFGLFEVSINALGTQVFTAKAALLMSLLHFFYGAGSSLSPRLSGVMASFMDWRNIYLLSIPLVLLFFIPSLFTAFPRQYGEGEAAKLPADSPVDSAAGIPVENPAENPTENPTDRNKARVTFFGALKTPMVWVFGIALGLMVTVETSSANWAGLYFQDVYHLDPKTSGAAFISNFFILFTISRLLGGFAIEKIGYMRSLFIAVLATLVIYILGFILGSNGINILPGLGLFVAILWPTTIAVAMGYFREDAPIMTSAMIVIGGTLNSGIQFLIGLVNRLAGPAWGYRSCIFYSVLVIISVVILARSLRHPYMKTITNSVPDTQIPSDNTGT
ncbi:MAG: MFS transporter [Treponema sp.]|nr:MFS transporter [Treponema sp.]